MQILRLVGKRAIWAMFRFMGQTEKECHDQAKSKPQATYTRLFEMQDLQIDFNYIKTVDTGIK